MNKFVKFLMLIFVVSMFFVSCAKKPLTLDENTSMKTLLKASDKEIKDLVIKEAKEKGDLSEDEINVEYIMRDMENQAIVVKIKRVE